MFCLPVVAAIAWSPLGEALAKARAENKPVYVLVTAPLNELSRETLNSLQTAETADYFQAHFVCVRVDREERPDFAAAAQEYLARVKQLGGWPANVWLTPDGQPYDGANYLPAGEEWGKRSLTEIAHRNAELWEHNTAACQREARHVQMLLHPRPITAALTQQRVAAVMDEGFAGWNAVYDAARPGFGDPPRYPEPELLRAMLRRGGADRERALSVLRALAVSGLRDPLDGGFFRYTQDAAGRLPYPQKLMGDQARLALAYMDAQALQPDPTFAEAARGALRYVLRRLARPDGLFARAEDGTGPGRETYFAWKADDIAQALGERAEAFDAAFGVAPGGNLAADVDPSGQFAGRNLLHRSGAGISAEGEAAFAADEAALLAARDRRGRLPEDPAAEAFAHGMYLAAVTDAAVVLHDKTFAREARRLARLEQVKFIGPDGSPRHAAGENLPWTPADAAALALGFHAAASAGFCSEGDTLAARLLAAAGRRFLAGSSQGYCASGEALAPEVFARAPAYRLAEHEPSPEALALLAGAPATSEAALRQALGRRAAASDVVPGDTLLTMAR